MAVLGQKRHLDAARIAMPGVKEENFHGVIV
jgi:hypothetical protein